jgi:hypothetical protein
MEYWGRGDDLVVRTEDLARILTEWMEKHNAAHPGDHTRRASQAKNGVDFVTGFTAKQYLMFYAEMSERALARVLRRETEYTTMDKADRLVTAIDETSAFRDGRLRPVMDPRVPQKDTGRV